MRGYWLASLEGEKREWPGITVNMDAQPNGDHEVHTSECSRLPSIQHRVYLGDFLSCHPAVTEAQTYYRQVNGCRGCCHACHTE